ncbi:MAG TPA: TatD family hydrolase [Acidobacteriota bacterium]|nr:TatD family hydrolase [Acidobacteriota bacterium]
MWIDSHCHLDFPQLKKNLGQVLERAREAKVERILTVGCVAHGPGVCESVTRMAGERSDMVCASLGVHPHDASNWEESVGREILGYMDHPQVLAWGEIGLDYYYDNAPRQKQQEAFRAQIRLARSVSKPIIIHSRDAEEDTCRILREEYAHGDGPRGVLHCFSSSWDLAECGLELGFYLGFGGMLTFNKAQNVRDVAVKAPLDRLLVETDAPFLAPVPHRGKTNEPAFVSLAGEKLAEIRGLSAEETAQATSDNFRRLFQSGEQHPRRQRP